MKVVYDATKFIQSSIDEVEQTLAEAVGIVVVVVFLFLGTFRAVIIPLVTIPLSLVGVGSADAGAGFWINLLTLLAMVLAIGLVVDDAIVVVENIHRHIKEGKTPVQAALIGAREIVGPVIAMTITLAAVYAPIGFLSGLTGVDVPRVRLHAGRVGDHLRRRRAHAVADDVLGAAHARREEGRFAQAWSNRIFARSPLVRPAGSTARSTTGR